MLGYYSGFRDWQDAPIGSEGPLDQFPVVKSIGGVDIPRPSQMEGWPFPAHESFMICKLCGYEVGGNGDDLASPDDNMRYLCIIPDNPRPKLRWVTTLLVDESIQ